MQDMSEIRRPERSMRDERLRQRLSTIETPNQPKSPRKKKNIITWLAGIVIVIIIIIAIIVITQLFVKKENKPEWQAVFLSDGQVYFGKVVGESARDVVLQDIYYLQEPGVLQQSSDISQQTGEFALIKLGNEIHGPYDEMRINRQHVLYIEDLKENSKVVKAIESHQENR